MKRTNALAGAVSLFVPGLGQLLKGDATMGLWFLFGFVAVWFGPAFALEAHFAMTNNPDPMVYGDAESAVGPLVWFLRLGLHVVACLDAARTRRFVGPPPQRPRRPPRSPRRRP